MSRALFTAIDVAAEPDAAFEAVSTAEGLRSFWTSDCDIETEVGGTGRFGFAAAPVDLQVRVDALDPGKGAAWTSLGPWPYWEDTTIAWELSPSDRPDATTLILLRHEGFADDYPDEELGRVTQVWSGVVERLKGYLERGEARPYLG